MKVAIDFGITVTDILKKESNGDLIHNSMLSKEKPSEELINEIIKDINVDEIESISLTGGHHALIGDSIDKIKVTHVNEVEAIGKGGFHLSRLNSNTPAIIVSAGSGTACILAKDGHFMHCSGTGVGGGTILGLSKLLLGTADAQEIESLASNGSYIGTDLILGDVVSGPIGLLPSDITAVNFGKITKISEGPSKEDIAAGIMNLVGQTIARIATSVAMAFEVKDIVVVGRTPKFELLRNSIEKAASLSSFNPHFPENAEYASAIGALLVSEE
tara:strand:+ start:1412 stop:2230 length:819 start_codon:yes stop_codon:yes gene_type:complete